jgi:hypothetical protein
VKIRVFRLPTEDGKIRLQIFVDEGTFAEAQEATKRILAKLRAEGITFDEIGEIESHRTGGDHVHVQQQEEQHEH